MYCKFALDSADSEPGLGVGRFRIAFGIARSGARTTSSGGMIGIVHPTRFLRKSLNAEQPPDAVRAFPPSDLRGRSA
jgi:hypothetical protein